MIGPLHQAPATAPKNIRSNTVCADAKLAVTPEVSAIILVACDGATVSSSTMSSVGDTVESAIISTRVGESVNEAVADGDNVGTSVGDSVPIAGRGVVTVVGVKVGATEGGTRL